MHMKELLSMLKISLNEGLSFEPGKFGEDYFINPFPFVIGKFNAEGSYLFKVEEGMLEVPFITRCNETKPSIEYSKIVANDRLRAILDLIENNQKDIVNRLIEFSEYNNI